MTARHGLRKGQRVRDLDGKDLGRVEKLYEGAFLVAKGFPILFRQEAVVLDDEIRGVRDGALVVARSDRALFELAAGELPDVWRIPAPPDFPAAATPGEARGVFETLAAERAQARGAGVVVAAAPSPATSPADEEREAVRRREEPASSPLAPSVGPRSGP